MGRQLTEAWGQFLSQFHWDWFVSLTFRDDPPTFRAHRMVGRFLQDLETAAGTPIFWFRADEYGERLGKFHIHLLIGNVAHLRRLNWMDEWNRRAGYARILEFDAKKKAAFYCAKYVAKQSGDWDLSDNLRAFNENQACLRLSGRTKEKDQYPSSKAAQSRSDRKRTRKYNCAQVLMFSSNKDTVFETNLMKVYRLEVTRGRGRFRQFF